MKKLPATGERLVTIEQNKTMVEHLHRYAFAKEYIAGKVILDIASGEGYGTNILAGSTAMAYGVDISAEAVEHASKRYVKDNLKFLLGSATSIPLADNTLDVVVSFETIEHHDRHDEMMQECKRVLKENGLIIISSPNKKFYSDIPGYKNRFHIKELYKEEFYELLKKYFKNVFSFNQGITMGSLIYRDVPVEEAGFNIYSGSYESVLQLKDLISPDYNLIIASDGEVIPPANSFFESDKVNSELTLELEKYKSLYSKIVTSTSYKFAQKITKPVAFFKKRKR